MPLLPHHIMRALLIAGLAFAGGAGITPPGFAPSAYAEEESLPKDIARFRSVYMEELRAQRIDSYLINVVRSLDLPANNITAWETAVNNALDVGPLYEAWARKIFAPDLHESIREEMAARETDAIRAVRKSQDAWTSVPFDQQAAVVTEAFDRVEALSEAHQQAILDIAGLMENADFSEILLEILIQIKAPESGEKNAREQISEFASELRQQAANDAVTTALIIHSPLPEAHTLAYRDHVRKPAIRKLVSVASRAQVEAFHEAIRIVTPEYRRLTTADSDTAAP